LRRWRGNLGKRTRGSRKVVVPAYAVTRTGQDQRPRPSAYVSLRGHRKGDHRTEGLESTKIFSLEKKKPKKQGGENGRRGRAKKVTSKKISVER